MTTQLDPQRYFESIDDDTERLLAVARQGLDAEVPNCPGWTVAHVTDHVAMVYEHKVRVMAHNGWPDPWPSDDVEELEPVEALVEAKAHLFEEFGRHELSDETTTFSSADSTIGFWVRRMALEAAVHRYDAEGAHDGVTPIPADLALDGVDEVLRVMLAGPWWAERVQTEHPVDAVVAVESAHLRWLCDVRATSVAIASEVAGSGGWPAASSVSGDPESVFLWLWGRVGDDRVEIGGDPAVVKEFRARLVECTG